MDSYISIAHLVAAICFLALLGAMFSIRKSRSHQENKTTASSSLTVLSPPSLSPPNWIHHVFPSFHGSDVRTHFLSHVLKELKSKAIDLFIDNDIERSKSIGPELVEAIKGSRIAIVLLSKNYASSTWCLNELVEIIKCREKFGQTVMSIFYQVDPTDVKKQTGDFGKVFKKTCKGKTEEEIRRWKHALTEVAQIAGFHSTNGKTEAEMIEDIAIDVSNKLNLSAPCSDFNTLVGIESHMTRMGPLLQLDSDEVRKIGILGPSGIGKTTIARSLFNRHSQDFQLSIFMDNIKSKYARPACSDEYSVMLYLQKQLMSQLTNEMGIKIPHLGVAKDRLKDKKVLVVLDDVDRSVQLEAMAKETSWFGPGSRIIITTQDENVLKASGIEHIHRVNLPSYDEALQMFCMYAFDQKYPKDGFHELACKARDLVGRLPLGLKVMGSYFRGMYEQDWTEALSRLRIHLDRDGEIASILKFGYDALNDEDKRLFIHISCFFSGEPVHVVERCLEKCFEDVRQGLRILSEKSLISWESGRVYMAELLVQLGRQIVRKESVSEPAKRQFLNDASDIGEVLSDDKADSSSVIGIDFQEYEEITWKSERAFERLSNLQFLRILGRGVNPRKFLIQLDMTFSGLKKLWKETKPLKNLKWMDLSYSKRLKELPNLSTATNLQELNLRACSSLVKLPSSIGNAINLQILNLSECSKLVKLPSSIGNIFNLQELNLRACSSLVKLPSSIGNAFNLQFLDLFGCSSLVKLPSSIGNAINLKILDLECCSSLVKLPSSIWNIVNLQELNLKYCSSLTELTSSVWNIANLEKLDLSGCSSLVELPSVENAINLRELNLIHCSSLVKLPYSIGNAINLQKLYLCHCSSLVELPSSMRNLRKLSELEIRQCSKLEVNLANINLESLGELDISNCSLLKSYSTDVEELVSWVEGVSYLHRLVLNGMKKQVSLPQLPDSILELDAEDCESLERLDCSFRNPDIRLNFRYCFRLNQEARDLISLMQTSEYAVFPAGEVPMCFTYRSPGSSLTLKLNQTPLGTSTKFKVCFICGDEEKSSVRYWGDAFACCIITSGGNALTYCYKEVGRFLTGHLYTFEVEVETEEVISTELVFEFEVNWVPDNSKICDIKECGILQLLEVPLLSFRDVVEHYEPSETEI
ncbi:hypothetical protein N665_0671s0013 [Sinapis alba]|nr:hypothetical protein N665_0671s0013 [Sinapis alba]